MHQESSTNLEVITGQALARREANRRNARRSTGPQTVAGKQRSSRNARKHGLLCREITVLEAGEDGAELKTLLKQLWEHYTPEGPVEGYLVEQIALSMWQMRRAQRLEAAEVRRYLQDRAVRVRPPAHDASDPDLPRSWEEGMRYMLGQSDLHDTAAGIDQLLALLQRAENSLTPSEPFSQQELENELREKFGDAENGFAASFSQAHAAKWRDSAEHKPAYQQMQQAMIARERASLERLKRERLAEEAARQHEQYDERRQPVLPEEVLARYQRYKSWYQKEFYRALDQLERLQRQRKGDYVPPPANLHLSADSPVADLGPAPPEQLG